MPGVEHPQQFRWPLCCLAVKTKSRLYYFNQGRVLVAVIAVIQQKGGVGKSTITANLAANRSARAVILLDLDPQQSLTHWAAMGDGLLKRRVLAVEVDGRKRRLSRRVAELAGES